MKIIIHILILILVLFLIYDKFLDVRYKKEREELKLETHQLISIDEKNRLLIFAEWRKRKIYAVSFDNCKTIEKFLKGIETR